MGAFSIVAEGGSYKIDREEVKRAAVLLFAAGQRHELRALPSARCKVVVGGDDKAIGDAVNALADEAVYYCLNPISPDADRAKKQTVVERRWFGLDIDTIRPKDVSATEAEKAKSAEVAHAIVCRLDDLGWPAPLMVDSGNGWHLLYRVELPNTDLVHQFIKKATYALADQFDSPFGKVDRATHDAPRVFKLPGTCARKGPDTADRPWRMARLVYEPERLECVSLDQIKALGEVEEAPKDAPDAPFATRATQRSLDAYVLSAINQECGKIALSVERNNALNAAAFNLGTMADWPEMREGEARAALHRAAVLSGLDRDSGCGLKGIAGTIQSGWEAGRKSPRQRPVEEGAKAAPSPVAIEPSRLVTFGCQVEPKAVKWTWANRIAPGFISIFAGKTGIGKSFVLCDIAAKLTTGRPMPMETEGSAPCGVLFISEDPIEYILVPRMIEMRADLNRVAFMTWEAMAAYTLGDIDLLERVYIAAKSPKLIVFDPPTNFLGNKDEHKNAEVRSVVMKLVAWLDSKNVAAVFVTHVNRRLEKGVEALDRIMGSVAWGTTARIAVGFADDKNSPGQCFCAGIKNNLGPKAKTLTYEIKATGPADSMATVNWLAEVDTTADEAFDNSAKRSVNQSIENWMEDRFREKRTWCSEELKQLAQQNGFSFNAYKTYRRGIIKKNVYDENGQSTGWWWTAIPGWPPETESESPESPESVDTSPC
jgi:hypothetical protein